MVDFVVLAFFDVVATFFWRTGTSAPTFFFIATFVFVAVFFVDDVFVFAFVDAGLFSVFFVVVFFASDLVSDVTFLGRPGPSFGFYFFFIY